MDLAGRIVERLAVLGMSQSELARRVGVRQSTINGLTRGEQRSTTKLHQIARELGTTPAYLQGETDDPDADAPELDAESRALVEQFAHLAPADRRALLQIARSMAAGGAPPSDTVHESKHDFRGEISGKGEGKTSA